MEHFNEKKKNSPNGKSQKKENRGGKAELEILGRGFCFVCFFFFQFSAWRDPTNDWGGGGKQKTPPGRFCEFFFAKVFF